MGEVDELYARTEAAIQGVLRLLRNSNSNLFDKDQGIWNPVECDAEIASWPLHELTRLMRLEQSHLDRLPQVSLLTHHRSLAYHVQ